MMYFRSNFSILTLNYLLINKHIIKIIFIPTKIIFMPTLTTMVGPLTDTEVK